MAKTDKKVVSKKADPIKAKPAPPVKSTVSLVKKAADSSDDSSSSDSSSFDSSSSGESSSEDSDDDKEVASVPVKATPTTGAFSLHRTIVAL